MTKTGLIEKLQESLADLKGVDMATRKRVDLSINAAQAVAVYDSLVDIIRAELEDTGEASLPGLVDLCVVQRAERQAMNLATNQRMTVPATQVVVAKPAKAIRSLAAGAKLRTPRPQSEAQRANSQRLAAIAAQRRAALQQAA